jgi:transposase
MEYFVGLDVSLRNCALCIVDSKGTMLLERELPCEIKDITECLASGHDEPAPFLWPEGRRL